MRPEYTRQMEVRTQTVESLPPVRKPDLHPMDHIRVVLPLRRRKEWGGVWFIPGGELFDDR